MNISIIIIYLPQFFHKQYIRRRDLEIYYTEIIIQKFIDFLFIVSILSHNNQ